MGTRQKIRDYLRTNLVGPRKGENEVIDGRVHLNYMMGILFARGTGTKKLGIEEATPDGQESEAGEISGEDQGDSSLSGLADAFSLLPSSVGLSFCAQYGTRIQVSARAGQYTRADGERTTGTWNRIQLEEVVELEVMPGKAVSRPIFDGKASVRFFARSLIEEICISTLTIVNEQEVDSSSDASRDLFQVELKCNAIVGKFDPYPATRIIHGDDGEVDRAMRISGAQPYAAGHGASVTWESTGDYVDTVALEFLPAEFVGRPMFDTLRIGDRDFDGTEVFELAYLSNAASDRTELCNALGSMVDFYEEWKNDLDTGALENLKFREMAKKRVSGIEGALERMRAGIELIRTDTHVHRAFQLANLAMLIQMVHASRLKVAGAPLELGRAKLTEIDYLNERGFVWRPFQLAFLLLVLESLVKRESKDRGAVDLIWFSTGGGKTEAYLLVAAFELLFRRIVYGQRGGGTAVINRYTYRFLTADQFERTARLACALERVRRPLSDELGIEPFTVGLWVGNKLTPNTYGDAVDKFEELRDSLETEEPSNAFQIEMCPDCGTRLFPITRIRDEHGEDNWLHYGFRATGASFKSFCPDPGCLFHERLPLSMVDKDLYQHPPSFLIGTIDKFAMMAWKEESGTFLGSNGTYDPPSLIIQDELHLISGPLGTLAGIYEAAFECVIMQLNHGHSPKFIASTATISNAVEQCRRLYAKETKVFPSPGILSKDSFFSRIDDDPDRCRLYLGVMGQGIKNTVAVYWTIAAILQAVNEIDMSAGERDSYWSLLAYHNSKRELGRTRNAVSDEVSDRLKVYCEVDNRRRVIGEPLEVSSNAVRSVSSVRAEMSRRYTPESPAIDVIPCTNMISVGIDIDRLGIMFVNGQPKLMSEYIQATSRVGRRAIPGLVVTCYSPTKPRDRSHYESFRHFHSTMDAFVEPTSVTPGALPAAERALHAALVIVMRFGGNASSNDAAITFDSRDAGTSALIECLRQRLEAAYEPHRMERQTISAMIDLRVREWERWRDNANFVYVSNDRNSTGLLRTYDDQRNTVGWRTLLSMRHVDVDINMRVV